MSQLKYGDIVSFKLGAKKFVPATVVKVWSKEEIAAAVDPKFNGGETRVSLIVQEVHATHKVTSSGVCEGGVLTRAFTLVPEGDRVFGFIADGGLIASVGGEKADQG